MPARKSISSCPPFESLTPPRPGVSHASTYFHAPSTNSERRAQPHPYDCSATTSKVKYVRFVSRAGRFSTLSILTYLADCFTNSVHLRKTAGGQTLWRVFKSIVCVRLQSRLLPPFIFEIASPAYPLIRLCTHEPGGLYALCGTNYQRH